MPPPMPNPAKRMTANPARPIARYRPGKAVQEEESSDEEEDEEEEEAPRSKSTQQRSQTIPRPGSGQRPAIRAQEEENDDDDEEGFVTDEEDEDEGGVKVASGFDTAAGKPVQRTAERTLLPSADQDKMSGANAESEDEESSSEEEAPRRKFQRPTFIKKAERKPSASTTPASQPIPTDSGMNGDSVRDKQTPEVVELDEQTRRLAQAELMIKDKLERDAIARAAGKKAWDDDDDMAPEDLVDDTDGLDPAAEYAAWRLRELQRLKRDREALIAREKEIEEIERRRNLTAEEREKEDREFLEKQKEEKQEGRSQANFLSKYHHKGAFFLDDEAAEALRKRDLMGAKFADEVSDKSTLPEYMRIRDMTKLGKKGRTRYTDLKGQDTGHFGESVKRWRGSGYDNNTNRAGDDLRGVDERFLPDRDGGRRPTASGANISALGVRKRRSRSRSRSRSPRRQRGGSNRDGEGGDSYRPSARRRSYSRSRSVSMSRSRSPPPGRRKSPSPQFDRERDKRRRIQT